MRRLEGGEVPDWERQVRVDRSGCERPRTKSLEVLNVECTVEFNDLGAESSTL